MEEWNKAVRILKDESMEPNKTAQLCERIFQDLRRMKIKDKKKFYERLGPEFENFTLRHRHQNGFLVLWRPFPFQWPVYPFLFALSLSLRV